MRRISFDFLSPLLIVAALLFPSTAANAFAQVQHQQRAQRSLMAPSSQWRRATWWSKERIHLRMTWKHAPSPNSP